MKRIFAIAITMALIMPISMMLTANTMPIVNANTRADFTHTVLAEDLTGTWCQYCPAASEQLKGIYNSHDYPFFFVCLIEDVNQEAHDRAVNDYNVYGYPTVQFDGGYVTEVGEQSDDSVYRQDIQDCGARTAPSLTMNGTMVSQGGAVLQINVNIHNNDATDYSGHLRSYITEIISRYKDYDGNWYPFGFLDYAFNEDIAIPANSWLNKTTTWNGSEHQDSNGDDFGDINPDNIMLVSAVFNSEAHVGNSGAGHVFTAYYVDQTIGTIVSNQYGVSLSSPNLQNGVNPGGDVYYAVNVKNTGTKADNISITANNVPSGWTAKIENQTTYLTNFNAGETKTVYARITSPSTALADTVANIDIKGTSQGNNTKTSKITTSTTVNAIYDIGLTCTQNQKSGNPSDTVSYSLDVKNNGNANDTILFDSGSGSWQTTFSQNSVDLTAGSQQPITLSVKIPDSANPNSYEQRTITASSGNDDTKESSITIKTTANPIKKVEITANSTDKFVLNGGNTAFTLNVKNTGNIQDGYTITYSGVPSGWTANLDTNSLTLNGGEAKDVKLTITAPSSANDGDKATITITATSNSDGSVKDAITITATVDTSPNYDMSLDCSNTEQSAFAGQTITYLITLTNNGNMDNTFDLSLSGQNSGWGSLNVNSVSLTPGESTQITLTVNVPNSANYGDKAEITLTATSQSGGVSKNILTTTTTTKQTDFTVEDITVVGDLVENTALTIKATIDNSGENANSVKIGFYVDNTLKNINTINLNANSQTLTEFTWTAVAGQHTLKISANYDNAITESSTTNNDLTKAINILSQEEMSKKSPTIVNVEYSSLNPKINETITFSVEVTDENLNDVTISYCSGDKCYPQVAMTLVNGKYTATIKLALSGEIHFTIKAKDTDNNIATKNITINVQSDSSDTAENTLTFSSSKPKVNEDLTISAPIQKTIDISKVCLKYSYDGETWEEVDMSYENNEYTATITLTESGTLHVKVIIKDKQGKETVFAEQSKTISKQEENAKSFIPGFELVVLLVGIIGVSMILRRRKF